MCYEIVVNNLTASTMCRGILSSTTHKKYCRKFSWEGFLHDIYFKNVVIVHINDNFRLTVVESVS